MIITENNLFDFQIFINKQPIEIKSSAHSLLGNNYILSLENSPGNLIQLKTNLVTIKKEDWKAVWEN